MTTPKTSGFAIYTVQSGKSQKSWASPFQFLLQESFYLHGFFLSEAHKTCHKVSHFEK